MASDDAPTVEFIIEVYPTSDRETDNVSEADWIKSRGLHTAVKPPTNGIRRNQRCWDFPSWRLRRAAATANDGGLNEMKECVKLGADVNSKDLNGRTALHEAAKAGNLGAAEYLVSLRADVDPHDDNGSTPLSEALRFNLNHPARFLHAKRREIHEAAAPMKSNVQQVPTTNASFWSKMATSELVRWLIVILNVVLELCQAVASEEAGDGEIGGKLYRDLSLGFSSMCLVLSMAELAYEAKKKGAKWRKRRGRYCLYYPGIHGRVFGSFTMWFGLISSAVQFCLNAVALVVKRAVVKFEYLALLLAVCLLVAEVMQREDETKIVLVHGDCEAEGGFKQGVSPELLESGFFNRIGKKSTDHIMGSKFY